eukprot:jgi/Chrzof1/9475/Cz04g04140.t1
MGVKISLTPLYGALATEPLCYLLRIEDFTFLLDCGWDERFDTSLLEPVISHLYEIDAVLISHPDTSHMGALPYLIGKAGLRAPVYATLPVVKMGTMFMYDHVKWLETVSDSAAFTYEDIDMAFGHITQIKYMQSYQLSGKGEGFTITPYNAGHLVGGAVWRIYRDSEEIVYAVDYNHKNERHLNGSHLEGLFSRPALLITDTYNALASSTDRTKRDSALLDSIMSTLRADGSVLMPVDTAGRVLELVLLLDSYWQEHRLLYPLVLLNYVAFTTLEFARSQLEWMNDAINRTFEHKRDNPFQCRHLKLCGSLSELEHLPKGPKVVLASGPSFESGMSRQLLLQWAEDAHNAIIITQKPDTGTVADTILQHASDPAPFSLTLQVSKRVPLEGDALEAHERQRAEEEAAAMAASDEAARKALLDAPLRASSGAISKLVRGASGNIVQVLPEDAFADVGPSFAAKDEGVLIDGFNPPAGALWAMFPDEDDVDASMAEKWDVYGGPIDTAAFQQHAGGQKGDDGADSDAQSEEAVEDMVPTVVITEQQQITLAAKAMFFDFEGRADGRSMRTIVSQIAPRQLVLVHGSAEATANMARNCQSSLAKYRSHVYTPVAGEVVPLSLTSMYKVALSDDVLAAVQLHHLGAYSLAWLDGLLKDQHETGAPLQVVRANAVIDGDADMLMDDGDMDGEMSSSSRVAAAGSMADAGGHGGIFIGDVKLSEVKQALAAAGIPSGFQSAGALLCAGSVLVRKAPDAEGQLVMEGPLSEDYFKVRDIVYGQYNIC